MLTDRPIDGLFITVHDLSQHKNGLKHTHGYTRVNNFHKGSTGNLGIHVCSPQVMYNNGRNIGLNMICKRAVENTTVTIIDDIQYLTYRPISR